MEQVTTRELYRQMWRAVRQGAPKRDFAYEDNAECLFNLCCEVDSHYSCRSFDWQWHHTTIRNCWGSRDSYGYTLKGYSKQHIKDIYGQWRETNYLTWLKGIEK